VLGGDVEGRLLLLDELLELLLELLAAEEGSVVA